MRTKLAFCTFILCISPIIAQGQQITAPEPQAASINGVVTDVDNDAIAGANIVIDGATPSDQHTAIASQDGSFVLNDLRPAISYHLIISAKGFADWTSPSVILTPGQQLELSDIKLTVGAVEQTVTAVLPEQLAVQQVKDEEKQRMFGVIPNFYVVYDTNFAPLTTKLKFQLAFRSATDIVSIAGTALLAGIDQATDTPDYDQGAKGYGQRFGANYADGVSDVLIGGAILPSLLHQDPRYFYQGTGTKKSRLLHAVESPFLAKGDNGRWQFNYSSIGGDLGSAALSNLYYPESDRGVGVVFSNALISTGGRIVNGLAQEFILHRFTTKAKDSN